jgi:hypothetical protein
LAVTASTLLVIITLLGTLYSPSNWDSMTYHLSRVVLWIQNGSVFPYSTNNFRQVQLTPGAEYLILIEQSFWLSDIFSNWIQLAALTVLGLGTYGWCLHWGISRVTSLLIVLTSFSAPMIVLQAQTTQNDLTAAVPVFLLSVLVIHRLITQPHDAFTAPLNQIERVALPVALAVGHLIKPTATLVSLPMALFFAAPTMATLLKDRRKALHLVCMGLLAATAALPEVIIRKVAFGTISISSQHVRTDLYNIGEQSFNGVRHFADHLPSSTITPVITRLAPLFGATPNIIVDTHQIFSANEDLTGNPSQATFYLIVLLLLILTPSRRAVIVAGFAMMSWFLLHAIVNNQPWMSRLQTPWFVMMAPACAFAAYSKPRALQVALWIAAMISVYDASLIVRAAWAEKVEYNEGPLPFGRKERYHGYFLRRPTAEIPFSRVKRAISSCHTLGYISGQDDYDYPIAWLTIRNGRRFEHRPPGAHVDDNCTLTAQP